MPKGSDPILFVANRVDHVPASSGLALALEPADEEGARLTVTTASGGAVLSSADGELSASLVETLEADGSNIWVTVPALTAVDPAGKLDEYVLQWSASNFGTGMTYYWLTRVEYCGGYHFGVSAFRRAHPELSAYSDEQIQVARAIAEEQLEYLCRVAFVPRGERETIRTRPDRTDSVAVHLRWAEPSQVYSLSVDGTAWTEDQIAALWVHPGGMLILTDGTCWPAGSVIDVHYRHGFDFTPPDLRRASIELAADILRTSDLPARATAVATDVGTIRLSLASRDGTTTGIPDVDAAIARYTRRLPEVG